MDKAKAILEENVQWLAVGLGGLFLLWMLYGFVLTPVATTKMGDVNVNPSDVARTIRDGPVAKLNSAMASSRVPPIRVGSYADAFLAKMTTSGTESPTTPHLLRRVAASTSTSAVGATAAAGTNGDATDDAAPARKTELVQLAAASLKGVTYGRSIIETTGAELDANDPDAEEALDRDWVTMFYQVDMKALAKEFIDRGIPEVADTTLFLRVQLERQEQKSDGTWGEPTLIAPPIVKAALEPLPAANAGEAAFVSYIRWAEGKQPELIQPDFYAIVEGDRWYKTGEEPVSSGEAESDYDPATSKRGPQTAEERAEYKEYQDSERERRREEYQNRPGAAPPASIGGPGGRFPGGAGMRPAAGGYGSPSTIGSPAPGGPPRRRNAPIDVDRPVAPQDIRYQARPPRGGMPTGFNLDSIPEYARQGVIQGMKNARIPGGPAGPGGTGPGVRRPGSAVGDEKLEMPRGIFNPSELADKIDIWAHDASVVPGKTYRYRARYVMKNPLFGVNVAPDDVRKIPTLESPWTPWSDPNVVSERTSFFVVGLPVQGERATFKVFHWKEGQLLSDTVTVSPGDQIGGTKDRVNFGTGWTLVDVRDDAERTILLLDADNQLRTRSHSADTRDERLKRFNELAATDAAAAANLP